MRTVCVSGGFDPFHIGHLTLIEDAHCWGRVVVILNSDKWLIRKKGYCFMPYEERRRLILALEDVYDVVPVNDDDNSVCEALHRIRPHYFANGGDRTQENTLELDVCNLLGTTPLFNIGGGKTTSSSELVRRACEQARVN